MATSGYLDTNVAPIEGASSIYPKAVRTTWSASFDEVSLLWTVTWVTTALGNPSYPSQWTTYHGGTTSFTSSYSMNPASPSGSSGWIEKTRHNQELCKGSFTIAIDDNGDSSFTINMNYHVNSTGTSGLCTASQSFSLDNKPQASAISAGSSSITIASTTGTLGYTITAKTDSYHRLYYGVSESSKTEIALSDNGHTAGTITGNISYSSILAKFPSAASGTLYFYSYTYKDSARTQTRGNVRTAAVTVNISVNATGIKPNISLGAISVNSSGLNSRLVAGYSKAQSVANISSPSGASLSTINYTISYFSGANTTQGSNTASSTTIVSPILPANTSNYTVTINATVIDGRGGSTSATAVTATVYGYAVPNITADIYRTAASSGSNPARDDAGGYVFVRYSATVSSVNSQNSLQSIGCTRTGASGNISNGSFISFADNAKDTFTVTARDGVASSSVSVNIYPVRFPLELYDDKNGTMYAKASGTLYASGIVASSWIDAQKAELHSGIRMGDADNTSSAWPWISGKNTASGKSFAIAQLGTSLYFIGSDTSRTSNGYDYGFVMNFSNGVLTAPSFSGTVSYATSAGSANTASSAGNVTGTVSVDHGGTGATSAAAARSNLGIGCTELYRSTLPTTSTKIGTSAYANYKAFLIYGRPSGSAKAQSTILIPKSMVLTSGEPSDSSSEYWQIADEANYATFYIWNSGNDLYMKKKGGTGVITIVFGIN